MSDHRRTDAYDYSLPDHAIAQTPVEPRDSARMLVDIGPTFTDTSIRHHTVAELDQVLQPGDTLVVNDTKVLAARLALNKPTGGAVEVLLLSPTGRGRDRETEWYALVRPSKRVAPGTVLELDGVPLVTVGERANETEDDSRRMVTVVPEAIETAGQVPLPPYITEPLADPNRYQTVFANQLGSVAAPTAGLHLTEALLGRLADRDIAVERVELQVGLGTFKPITADLVEQHPMHAERYAVDPDSWDRIRRADRVVAVGTTVVRTLESVARTGRLTDDTSLFIRRGFDWQVVDLLLTNYHVPRSSLLVLVDALIGDRWRELYKLAVDDGYRFLSFGDCMLVERRPPG